MYSFAGVIIRDMNKDLRKELERANTLIKEAKEIVESSRDKERDKLDNMPEGLLQSDHGQQVVTAASALEDTVYDLDSAIENINTAIK